MNNQDEAIIEQALRMKIDALIEEEALEASRRIHARVKAAAGQMAIELLSYYSIERFGNDLRITIKTGGVQ